MQRAFTFPFSAIIGQGEPKKALLLNLINPKIGGLILCGEKGTAKSTLVRAAAALGSRKYLELPLSISEERLVGSIDMEATISSGSLCLQPGILADADQGMIYVDEINLLPDHIVDILLNVSSDKINRVEREGMSTVQPCDFILIGTMNAEEGFLRPQFLDRFGLFVLVQSEKDPAKRVDILKRRQAYDCSAVDFVQEYARSEEELKNLIHEARTRLLSVVLTDKNLKDIVELCLQANIDGHRGDLVVQETAKAIAALAQRKYVTKEDIEEAAHYALAHRRRNMQPPEEEEHQHEHPQDEETKEDETQQEEAEPDTQDDAHQENDETETDGSQDFDRQQDEGDQSDTGDRDSEAPPQQQAKPNQPNEQVFEIGKPFKVRKFGFQSDRKPRTGQGKRTEIRSASKSGRYIFSTSVRKYDDLALDATIRAAAPFQHSRNRTDVAIAIETGDIREKVRQKKVHNLLVFVVDGSGSIGVDRRMAEAKAAVLSILQDAYVKRDKVAMVVFHADRANVVLPPTRSVQRGYTLLEEIKTGGKTPLNAGIAKAVQVVKGEFTKDKNLLPMIIIITDGRGNVPMKTGANPRLELMEMAQEIQKDKTMASMVIDIEKSNLLSFGLARQLAINLDASYYKIDELKSESLLALIENERGI